MLIESYGTYRQLLKKIMKNIFLQRKCFCGIIVLTRERFLYLTKEGFNIKTQKTQKMTYTVREVAEILGIGRTAAYNFVKENHFRVVRIGTSIRISKQSFDEWLNSNSL